MEVDQTTYQDLSIFEREEEYSIFHRLNFTTTNGGREKLLASFHEPLHEVKTILEVQEVIKYLKLHEDRWSPLITNGTIIMIGEYMRSQLQISSLTNIFDLWMYKTIKAGDFAFINYSLTHVSDLLRGMQEMVDALAAENPPALLGSLLLKAELILDHPHCREIAGTNFNFKVPGSRVLRFDHFIRRTFKHKLNELIEYYYMLDTWHSMAIAATRYHLCFPEFVDIPGPYLKTEMLYHILVPEPVGNDIFLDRENNFLFLTGANMAGKSTFIKAMGIAVFLAHLGMGVPADRMELTLFDGILSNIQVQDNIMLGESYFYNEVQRIRNTIGKVNTGRNWLILIDELFKGTNIEDAKNCSVAVIRGLSRVNDSLFVLSTHLYEIATDLGVHPNIRFQYLESRLEDGIFQFNYRLKEGISNDRLGYLILKREKVIDMLDNLNNRG